MNRTHYLSFCIVVAGIAALLAGTAQSQLGNFKNYVALQPTTPGTSQSGHANVSGTLKAGFLVGDGANVTNVNAIGLSGFPANSFAQLSTTNVFSGGNTFTNPGNSFTGIGSGLTSVNADLLDGINSTAFLQAIPNPLILSGTTGNGVIQATNSSNVDFATAIHGSSTGASQHTIAGLFNNTSTNGLGVVGSSSATSGFTIGVEGNVSSSSGTGVYGLASSTTGTNNGVLGQTGSASGYGMRGENTSVTGGTGIFGLSGPKLSAPFANPTGVFGEANGPGGFGVFGFSSNDGTGVFAQSSGSNGAALVAQGVGGASAAHFFGRIEVAGAINKDYGASTHQAVPIAYGTVSSTGAIVSGSGNWTVVWNAGTLQYEITIPGVSYSTSMTTVLTPIAVGAPRIGGASSVGTDLAVAFFTTASAKVQVSFHFVVYNP